MARRSLQPRRVKVPKNPFRGSVFGTLTSRRSTGVRKVSKRR